MPQQTNRITDHKADFSLPKSFPDSYATLKDVAKLINIPVWKLSRAAKLGLFPTYSVLNTRRLVKLSEVIAAIQASRQGGAQ